MMLGDTVKPPTPKTTAFVAAPSHVPVVAAAAPYPVKSFDCPGLLSEEMDPLAVDARAKRAVVERGAAVAALQSQYAAPTNEMSEAEKNEAFKREVDEMIRATGATPTEVVAAPAPTHDLPSLLDSLGLDEFAPRFAEEGVDLPMLEDALKLQGKAALDDILKEVGMGSVGKRTKVANAIVASSQ